VTSELLSVAEATSELQSVLEMGKAMGESLARENELKEALRKQQQELLDLETQRLAFDKKKEEDRKLAEQNRLAIAIRTNEMVEGLLALLPRAQLFIEGLTEWQKEDARWKDRMEEVSLLILTGKGNGNKARVDELKTELVISHTQRLLIQETENLYQLREQASAYGMGVPISKLNEIKQAERTVEKLQIKLDELNK